MKLRRQKTNTKPEKGQELIELDMNSKKDTVVNTRKNRIQIHIYMRLPPEVTLGNSPSDRTLYLSRGETDSSNTCERVNLKQNQELDDIQYES